MVSYIILWISAGIISGLIMYLIHKEITSINIADFLICCILGPFLTILIVLEAISYTLKFIFNSKLVSSFLEIKLLKR